MSKSFSSLLSSALVVLDQYKSPLIGHLRKGLKKEQVLKVAEEAELEFPDELITLYTWRNGFPDQLIEKGKVELFPSGIFLSLETAISIYRGNRLEDYIGNRNMFPLFGFWEEFYFIDLNKKSETYKAIYYFAPGEDEYEVLTSFFDSIESCFDTIVAWYKENAFTFKNAEDEEEWNFECDLEKYEVIGQRHNPNASFWTDDNRELYF